MKVLVLFDLARAASAGEQFSPRELKEQEDKPTEADVLATLKRLGHEVETLGIFDDVLAIVETVKRFAPDVVFNLTESFHSNRRTNPTFRHYWS